MLQRINGYQKYALPGFLVLLAVFPLAVKNDYLIRIGINVLLYAVLAGSLNVINGYSGQFNIGQAGFYCIGAYTAGILATRFGFGFWLLLPLSGLMAALASCFLGLPTSRMKGVFLAITTLGFSEIVRLIVINWTALTRGPMGIPGIPLPKLGDWVIKSNTQFYFIILGIAVIMLLTTHRVIHSRVGRAWIAIREDEPAARSLGVSPFVYKLLNLCYGTFWAGVAGCFYAFFASYISADSFTLDEGFSILAMILVGGQGTLAGPVVGAFTLTVLPEIFRFTAQYRLVVFGLIILVIMFIRPQGIVGSGVLSRRYRAVLPKMGRGRPPGRPATAPNERG